MPPVGAEEAFFGDKGCKKPKQHRIQRVFPRLNKIYLRGRRKVCVDGSPLSARNERAKCKMYNKYDRERSSSGE